MRIAKGHFFGDVLMLLKIGQYSLKHMCKCTHSLAMAQLQIKIDSESKSFIRISTKFGESLDSNLIFQFSYIFIAYIFYNRVQVVNDKNFREWCNPDLDHMA